MAKPIPISKRALSQRIDRLLRKDGQSLRAHRGTDLWFIIEVKSRAIVKSQLTLQKLAAQTGALQPFERLED